MVIELIKYILPGFIQYHPILGRNFLSLGLARLRAVLALAEVKPRLMCAGRLDSHLSLVGLVLGLWPVCLGFTTSMQKRVHCNFGCIICPTCQSRWRRWLLRLMRAVRINRQYLCTVARDCSSKVVASSIRGYHPLRPASPSMVLLIAGIQVDLHQSVPKVYITPASLHSASLYKDHVQLFTDLSFRHHRIVKNQN